jgi:DNA-binding winged helix-turn-helix (wHTH) protein/TolB-like protein
MAHGDRQLVRFGDFEFNPSAGELRRGDVTTRLEPQPARVLALLVERAGEVVSRTDLQQQVWSGDTFVDFERGLNYCISQIRTALGDSASGPRFIETLPRRGYRFVALPENGAGRQAQGEPLQQRGGPAGDRDAAAQLRPPPQRRSWPRIAAAALILVLGLAGAWTMIARRQAAAHGGAMRIAVVPFDNETGMAEYDRLAQSLTDATVARLANDPDHLAVIGNAAILREPRGTRNLLTIGNALGVGHVVLGQVQQIGGQLRITAHLIRVDGQAHMWAQRFEPTPADRSQLDQQVSEAVAGAVARRLLGS